MKTLITVSWILIGFALLGSLINLVEGTFDVMALFGTLMFLFYALFTYKAGKMFGNVLMLIKPIGKENLHTNQINL